MGTSVLLPYLTLYAFGRLPDFHFLQREKTTSSPTRETFRQAGKPVQFAGKAISMWHPQPAGLLTLRSHTRHAPSSRLKSVAIYMTFIPREAQANTRSSDDGSLKTRCDAKT